MTDAAALQREFGGQVEVGAGQLRLHPREPDELSRMLRRLHEGGGAPERVGLVRDQLSTLRPIAVGSGTVRAGAGLRLGEIERRVAESGFTLGTLPPAVLDQSLGEFLEGPLGGRRAVLNGRTEPICSALGVMLPDGTLFSSHPAPRHAAGPDLSAIFLGAGGRAGWILEATLRLVSQPASRRWVTYSFGGQGPLVRAVCLALEAGVRLERARLAASQDGFSICLEVAGSEAGVERGLVAVAEQAAAAQGRPEATALEAEESGVPAELTWTEAIALARATSRPVAGWRLAVEGILAVPGPEPRPAPPPEDPLWRGLWSAIDPAGILGERP